jgi:hypothetical protein
LKTWQAILLAAIIIVVGAAFFGKVWEVMTAIGTLGAAGVALYLGVFREYLMRPVIELKFYERIPPHLRQTPRYENNVKSSGYLYPISIGVTNTGRITAKNTSVVIKQMWTFNGSHWIRHPNWIPAPIRWALDEKNPSPSDMKDLVPHRPYVFNLAALDSTTPNILDLKFFISPGNQLTWYETGYYCFAVMVCAEGIGKPVMKFFYVNWEGGADTDLEHTRQRIHVRMEDGPPDYFPS